MNNPIESDIQRFLLGLYRFLRKQVMSSPYRSHSFFLYYSMFINYRKHTQAFIVFHVANSRFVQRKNGQRLDLSVMHLTIISRTRHLVKIFHVQMLWSLPL